VAQSLAKRSEKGVIPVGDVQRMSAETGIGHSEYNASQTEPVHFLQILIMPEQTDPRPGYEQRSFVLESNRGKWIPVVTRSGREGAVRAHQHIEFLVAVLNPGQQVRRETKMRSRPCITIMCYCKARIWP
jgi:quercetin 2,3-dioxygenase